MHGVSNSPIGAVSLDISAGHGVAMFDSETLPLAVRALFEKNNYDVSGPLKIHGAEVDLIAKAKGDPFAANIYIEVTIKHVDNIKYGNDITKFILLREKDPACQCLIVTSTGFTLAVTERAKESRITTITYDDLLSKFERFEPYIDQALGSNSFADKLRKLASVYEEPNFEDSHGSEYATKFLKTWASDGKLENRWLIVTGEYGTGKTALTEILLFRWIQEYKTNPALPIPFRIELRDFTRQFDARGLLHHFLDSHELGHLPIEYVFSLIKQGKIILLLDGYDEMAQYMHPRERRACLETLAELSADGAKGILTTRPNYFSEAEELQVFEALYSSLEGFASSASEANEIINQERIVDELLKTHYIERFERKLKDLTPAQTKDLVIRHLADDLEGQTIILTLLDKIFRSVDKNDTRALSGKPVIITYLLEVVNELKESKTDINDRSFSEWDIYSLIVEKLMMRDFKRTPKLIPSKRRIFLQELALWLSQKGNPSIDEHSFKNLISKAFKDELKRILPEDRKREIDDLFADLRSSATLTKSDESDGQGWKFSHNSLREFLVCQYLVENILNGRLAQFKVPVSDAMSTFITSLPDEKLLSIRAAIKQSWKRLQPCAGIGNVLSVLWSGLSRLDAQKPFASILPELIGKPTEVHGITLYRISFSNKEVESNYTSLHFYDSTLSDVNMSQATLDDASFNDCLLEEVDLTGATLKNTQFKNCLFYHLNLSNTKFENVTFNNIDLDSSIIVEMRKDAPPQTLSGKLAIGYLHYSGAITDPIEDIYTMAHYPNFAIMDKICDKLTTQTIHQRLGLAQRGASRQDPRFAERLLDTMINNGFLSDVRGKQVRTTPIGRIVFQDICDRKRIHPAMQRFLMEY